MTQPYPPQQPGYPPQQGYPPQTQPYPQQQPAYPPAPPVQPGYPPQQGYPPPQPGYGYPQQPPAPPAPAPARGTLSDFYGQPAGGSGKSIASWFQVPGQTLVGQVARAITDADVQQKTDMITKQPKFFNDNRPQLTLTVPLLVDPNVYREFPDGRAAWIVGSGERAEMDRAMREAGVSEDQIQRGPEAGAHFAITFVGLQQVANFPQPKKAKQAKYFPPGQPVVLDPAPAQQGYAPQPANGQTPQPQYAPQQFAPQPAAPAPQQAYQNPGYAPQPLPAPQPVPQTYQQPVPQQQAAPPAPSAQPPAPQPYPPAQQAQTAPGPQPITPDNAALVASLNGNQPAQQPAPAPQPQG
jgi:hypothetical protein